MIISKPPLPSPINKSCDYQIETHELGTRVYKCISQKEYQQMIDVRLQQDEKFNNLVEGFFHSWILYTVLVIIFILWLFWPRNYDYQPFEKLLDRY